MKCDGASEIIPPIELAKICNVIFSVVWKREQTEEVIFGSNDLWQVMGENHILVIYGTLPPDFCSELTERVKHEKGTEILDAPVSGGP